MSDGPSAQTSRYGPVLDLIRSGAARSRADVARLAGISASTASARVDALIRRGVVCEEGIGPSSGGRRPRQLSVQPSLGTLAAIDLNADGAHLALADAAGRMLQLARVSFRLEDGPRSVLEKLAGELDRMRQTSDLPPLLAVVVGVPGPVGLGRDAVVSAARMPGWNGISLRDLGQTVFGVVTVVENDANLIALGEFILRGSTVGDLVAVKVGTGIGCGVVAGGKLYRGATGMAGDISHTTVLGAPSIPCSCGRTGCLDVVASGSALLIALREAGVNVRTDEDLLRLVHDAHPLATSLVREAGERVGVVLATVVSFFNPTCLVLAGHVTSAAAFVSAVTSTIYASCLPATTAGLQIAVSDDNTDAALHGAIRLALDAALASEAFTALVR